MEESDLQFQEWINVNRIIGDSLRTREMIIKRIVANVIGGMPLEKDSSEIDRRCCYFCNVGFSGWEGALRLIGGDFETPSFIGKVVDRVYVHKTCFNEAKCGELNDGDNSGVKCRLDNL